VSHGRPTFREASRIAPEARVLVVFAHPHPHRSRVNRVLADAVRDLPGTSFHDLYEKYPDAAVDVPAEQALLLAHDVIVLQHPFYWYSVPPLLKLWLDLVLTWGWAYGKGGVHLRGKTLVHALTTGGGEAAYREGGFNRFTIRQLLAPMDQTAHLCGMGFLPPFVVHGTHKLDDAQVLAAATDYRRVIEALVAGRLPPNEGHRMNDDLAWTDPVTA
jgi:glutathione-regulated potassium-efflux system ancillary protein KefG